MSLQHAPRCLAISPWLFLFVWSPGYGVAKLALESTAPLNLLLLRFIGATLALLPVVVIVRLDWPDCLAVNDLFIVALFLHLGHCLCIYLGSSLGASAGLLALFAASIPVFIVIVSSRVNRHFPPLRIWLGLVVGSAGAAWEIFGKRDFSDGALLGAVLGFVAVISLSLRQVYDKRQQPKCRPLLVYMIQYLLASAVSLPMAWLIEGYQTESKLSLMWALGFFVFGNSLLGIF